jgi:hypothetical protein
LSQLTFEIRIDCFLQSHYTAAHTYHNCIQFIIIFTNATTSVHWFYTRYRIGSLLVTVALKMSFSTGRKRAALGLAVVASTGILGGSATKDFPDNKEASPEPFPHKKDSFQTGHFPGYHDKYDKMQDDKYDKMQTSNSGKKMPDSKFPEDFPQNKDVSAKHGHFPGRGRMDDNDDKMPSNSSKKMPVVDLADHFEGKEQSQTRSGKNYGPKEALERHTVEGRSRRGWSSGEISSSEMPRRG